MTVSGADSAARGTAPSAKPERTVRTGAKIAIFTLLVVSVPSFVAIPIGWALGLDFQNLDAFHDCAFRDNPYLATGVQCGDVLGRDMYYPPLLYWSFAWTRLLSVETGYFVWAAASLAAVLLAASAWVPRGSHGRIVAMFVGLLVLQFPMLFALSRGNNDVLVVLIWTVAALMFASARFGSSGVAAGLAAALKVYPAVAVAVIGLGLLWWLWGDRATWRPLVRFALGCLGVIAITSVALFEQTRLWVTGELGAMTAARIPPSIVSHSVSAIAPAGVGWLLSLSLLVAWLLAAARRLRSDPTLVFAGALAISTYFSPVSNDYNLITVYPLLILLFVRAISMPWSALANALLILGLIAVISDRTLYAMSDLTVTLHIVLQWVWLIAVGLAVALSRLRSSEPGVLHVPAWLPQQALNTASRLPSP